MNDIRIYEHNDGRDCKFSEELVPTGAILRRALDNYDEKLDSMYIGEDVVLCRMCGGILYGRASATGDA